MSPATQLDHYAISGAFENLNVGLDTLGTHFLKFTSQSERSWPFLEPPNISFISKLREIPPIIDKESGQFVRILIKRKRIKRTPIKHLEFYQNGKCILVLDMIYSQIQERRHLLIHPLADDAHNLLSRIEGIIEFTANAKDFL